MTCYHIIFFIFLIKQNQYWFRSVLKGKITLSQYIIFCLFNNLNCKESSYLKFHTPLICQWLCHNLLNFLYFPLFLNLREEGKINVLVHDPLLSLLTASILLCFYSFLSTFPTLSPPPCPTEWTSILMCLMSTFCLCIDVTHISSQSLLSWIFPFVLPQSL